jgi:hypothetical protein
LSRFTASSNSTINTSSSSSASNSSSSSSFLSYIHTERDANIPGSNPLGKAVSGLLPSTLTKPSANLKGNIQENDKNKENIKKKPMIPVPPLPPIPKLPFLPISKCASKSIVIPSSPFTSADNIKTKHNSVSFQSSNSSKPISLPFENPLPIPPRSCSKNTLFDNIIYFFFLLFF